MLLKRHIFTLCTAGLFGTCCIGIRRGFSETPAPPTTMKADSPWKDGKHPTINSTDGVEAPPAPFRTPDDELKTFHLPAGFTMELVAAEPMIEIPVVMNFDADGRLWVVEMIGYMRDAVATDEDKPSGRVVILEDADGDGRMDKRTVFAEGLVMPRAVLPVYGGALVAAPPRLWFMKDTDGDGAWDHRIEIASDYGKKGENPEHMANGPYWGMDNWIHSANYGRAFRRIDGKWISRAEPARGQWGYGEDDWGRAFHDDNSDYFRGDLVPAEYSGRNPNDREKLAGVNVQIDSSQEVFSGRPNFATNRAYNDGYLRSDGTLKLFTAACSPMIYRGGIFPDGFDGNCFVCEPSANLVRRSVIHESGNALRGENAFKAQMTEFLWSDDERFRPVDLKTGPDGAIYVLDMYRGIIQHKGFLTPYLKELLLSRGMDQPFETGRIWRIAPANFQHSHPIERSKAKAPALIDDLKNPIGVVRDVAKRLLIERHDPTAADGLRSLAKSAEDPRSRAEALWTLDGIGALDRPTLMAAFVDRHPRVRSTAIRLSEKLLLSHDEKVGPTDTALRDGLLKLSSDTDPAVRLQFGLTVSQFPDDDALRAVSQMLSTGEIDPYIRDATISGLKGREFDLLSALTDDWKDEGKGRGDLLGRLAGCVLREGKPERVKEVLGIFEDVADSAKRWQGTAVLEGLRATITSKKGPKIKPVKLPEEPTLLASLSSSTDDRLRAAGAALMEAITWPDRPLVAKAPPKPLTEEQQARATTGKKIYLQTCAACHQSNGEGLEGKAPALAGSPWVEGSDRRIIRIVLNGLRGPITVNGETVSLEMPGIPTFTDDEIAGILTYVRREWENAADPVDPATVTEARAETARRTNLWTEAELLKVK